MPFEWKSDIELKDASEDTMRIVLQEAKDRLQGTTDSYSTITAKANVLLGFIVTLSMGLFAYSLKDGIPDCATLFFLALYTICAAISAGLCVAIIGTKKIDVNGYCPDILFKKEKAGKDHRELMYFLIHEYGGKIVDNLTTLREPLWQLRLAMRVYLLGVVLALGAALLLAISAA